MLETQVKGKPPGLNEAVVWDHQVGGRCCEGLAFPSLGAWKKCTLSVIPPPSPPT